MSEVPTGKELRVEKATPYASQVMNDSTYPGKYVDDALDGVYTTIGCRRRAVAEDLNLRATDEKSIALGGSASDAWSPTFAIVKVTAVDTYSTGTAQIQIGIASGGDQIIADTSLTGVISVGQTFRIPLGETVKAAITANATIYVQCTVALTATTFTADVYVYGEIL
jgi:hypothetical protein